MSWYSKELGDGVEAFKPTDTFQQAFFAWSMSLAKQGRQLPPGAALFSKYDLQRNIVTAYITPEAAMVAQTLGFAESPKPTIEDLGLLFGSPQAWDIHFPGETPRRSRRSSTGSFE